MGVICNFSTIPIKGIFAHVMQIPCFLAGKGKKLVVITVANITLFPILAW